MKLNIALVSAGAVSSLGMCLASTAAAIRAGLDNFHDTDFFAEGDPILGARIPSNGDSDPDGLVRGGIDEYTSWAYQAIEECSLRAASQKLSKVLLVTLNPDPDLIDTIDRQELARRLLQYTRKECGLNETEITLAMHDDLTDGLYGALERAQRWLAEHSDGHVIIVSVDSWLRLPKIQYALQHERLLTETKAEGFIPAEGAAAILLALAGEKSSTHEYLRIMGAGKGLEEADLLSLKPCFGYGLSSASNEALSDAGIAVDTIELRLSNLTGEEYFFEEAALAWAKLLRKPMNSAYQWQQPATKLGNIGKAFDVFLLAYAFQLHASERHPGTKTLIELSSQNRLRTAIAMERA